MGRIRKIAAPLVLAVLVLLWAALPSAVLAAAPTAQKAAPAAAKKANPAAKSAEPRPELALFKEATFLLPADSKVQASWVLPPASKGGFGLFSVDPEGNPVLAGSYPERIVYPSKRFVVRLAERDIKGMAHLASGGLLVATGNELGFLAAPEKKTLDKDGFPLVDFQRVVATSLEKIGVFSSVGNAVYIAGYSLPLKRHVLYLLRTVQGAGFQDLLRVFDAEEKITAAIGNDEATYVALGQTVLRVSRQDPSVSVVYRHPTADISSMVLSPAGLLVSTGIELVLVGQAGSLELLRSTGHSMCLRGDRLYLLFHSGAGVLALDNLADLKRFNLGLRPVAQGEAAPALSVTGVRFFESGPPPYTQKTFAESFPREGLRSIVGQIDFKAAGKLAAQERHTLTVTWFEPAGGRLVSTSYPVTLSPKAATGQVLAALGGDTARGGYIPKARAKGGLIWRFGKDSLGARYPGRYTMQVQVDGVPAGEWSFSITGQHSLSFVLGYNDTAALKALLAGGLNVKAPDTDGYLPLNLAMLFGTTGMVEMLLKAGADPDQKDKEGVPALGVPSPQVPEWKDKAELLLRHGANVNATTGKDNTPLLYGYGISHEYHLFFLEHGANLNAVDPLWKTTAAASINPLQQAYCHPKTLAALVKRGINLRTIKDSLHRSALGVAVSSQDVMCVETLLGQETVMLSFGQSWPNQPERSVLYLALENLESMSPERLESAVRIVRLLQKKKAFLRPGEGFVMLRGTVAPRLFSQETLLETLRTDETAMRVAYDSKLPEIQELAVQVSMDWARRLTALSEDKYDLYKAHRFCQDGFKSAENRYQTLQLELRPDGPPKDSKAPGVPGLGTVLMDRPGGGAYVMRVLPGGAAERGGLKVGDILQELDGQKVKNAAEAAQAVGRVAQGGALRAVFLRDEPFSNADLHLACGILEREVSEKGLSEMHLTRWLAANPNHEQARSVRSMLGL